MGNKGSVERLLSCLFSFVILSCPSEVRVLGKGFFLGQAEQGLLLHRQKTLPPKANCVSLWL